LGAANLSVDVLIVGGGIAGLWLLAELRAKGVNALLATDELGKGQTIASQGIIHGGTKYALTGKLTGATLAIGDMPRLWRAALNGEGAVDLRKANILTESQLLWTSSGIGSRLTGFFASHAMKSRMEAVPRKDYPELFQHSEFHGGLYRLDEPVLDVPSLLETLREQLSAALMQVDITRSRLNLRDGNYYYAASLPDGTQRDVMAQQIVLTAGAGNESLLAGVGDDAPVMQRRPLQMVMVRGDLPRVYAHALGMSDKPRATITSHRDAHGKTVWYIGGQPAEQGVGKPAAEVIAATRKELADLLPWMDFSSMEWATWNVDRAEGRQPDGSRPDQPQISRVANVAVAWPTKLAFAPMLAARLLENLPIKGLHGHHDNGDNGFVPPVAVPAWEQASFSARI
jgi:glycerol-3-phosphate dehydrogenase